MLELLVNCEGKVLGCLVIKEGFPTLCICLSKGKFQFRGAEPVNCMFG